MPSASPGCKSVYFNRMWNTCVSSNVSSQVPRTPIGLLEQPGLPFLQRVSGGRLSNAVMKMFYSRTSAQCLLPAPPLSGHQNFQVGFARACCTPHPLVLSCCLVLVLSCPVLS